jgi:hypothetical protein
MSPLLIDWRDTLPMQRVGSGTCGKKMLDVTGARDRGTRPREIFEATVVVEGLAMSRSAIVCIPTRQRWSVDGMP